MNTIGPTDAVRHIIFDLDGTLIDSKPEILDTYNQVFRKLKPPGEVDPSGISLTATLQATLEKLYPDDDASVSKAKNIFADVYDKSDYHNTLLYQGVTEGLMKLRALGYVMHIATNKRIKPTLRILEKKGIRNLFATVKASDQRPGIITSKEEMVREICTESNIRNGYMVGDGEKDVEAGQTCGLTTIAVTYGYEKKESLIKKKPTFVIDVFSQLITVIDQ